MFISTHSTRALTGKSITATVSVNLFGSATKRNLEFRLKIQYSSRPMGSPINDLLQDPLSLFEPNSKILAEAQKITLQLQASSADATKSIQEVDLSPMVPCS